MAAVNNNAPVNVDPSMNFDGLDIAAMMMMVQSKRAELLESGLKQQMEVVKSKNSQISALQGILQAATTALGKCETEPTATIPADAKKIIGEGVSGVTTEMTLNSIQNPDGTVNKDLINEPAFALQRHYNPLVAAAGYSADEAGRAQWAAANPDKLSNADAWIKVCAVPPGQSITLKLPGDSAAMALTDRKGLEAYIANLNTKIDSLSNTQQMDMLRLQSSANKRNEAIEMMSKTLDTVKNSNSGIVQKF